MATLTAMTKGIIPISASEYESRLEKAQRLMIEADIDALYLEGGSPSPVLPLNNPSPDPTGYGIGSHLLRDPT